jgi:hypothetical protein
MFNVIPDAALVTLAPTAATGVCKIIAQRAAVSDGLFFNVAGYSLQ